MKAFDNQPELRSHLLASAAYDLADGPRPRLAFDAIVADAVDTFFGPDVVQSLDRLTVPAHVLYATAGRHDGAKPFLTDAVVAAWEQRVPTLTSERVSANHVTLVFQPEV